MNPVSFIVNASAGSAPDREWLESNRSAVEAIARGGAIHFVSDGPAIDEAVRQSLAQGCRGIVAAGGDGTVNAVACRLVGTSTALGVLPLGTLNHFAKDLGIPIDPAQALAVIEADHQAPVDVGEVNGHCFVNNSSLGLYPDIVRDRERQQQRLGRGKWAAFAWALWGALRRYPFLDVVVEVDGQQTRHRTPFLFVGNNDYRMDGLNIGSRERLDGGVLCLYIADRASRARLLALGLRAVLGRLRQARDLQTLSATHFSIDTRHRFMRVATDGEVQVMPAPLHYRIHRTALRVFVPAPSAERTA